MTSATPWTAIGRPSAAPSIRSRCSSVKYILTSIPQAFHTLGFLTRASRDLFHWRRLLSQRLTVQRRDRAFKQIDLPEFQPDSRSRRGIGQGRNPGGERQAREADEVLAQDHRLDVSDLLLLQPAQTPVILHCALVRVIAGIGDLERAQRADQS